MILNYLKTIFEVVQKQILHQRKIKIIETDK